MLGNKKQRNYNSERLKAIVKMGEVIPAKIVGRPNSQTFLIFVKGEKVLAQSILEFESNQIIVKVTQKFPKLILKILPCFVSNSLDKIVSFANEHSIELSQLNQQFLEFLIANNFKIDKDRFQSVSKGIVSFFNLFNNLSILELKDMYSFYNAKGDNLDLINKLLTNELSFPASTEINHTKTFLDFSDLSINSKEKEIIKSIINQIDSFNKQLKTAQIKIKFFIDDYKYKLISYLHQINKDNEKFQFLVVSELYGKLNVLVYFDDNDVSIKFYTENTLIEEFLKEKNWSIRSIINEFDFDLIFSGFTVTNPISIDKGEVHKL